MVSLAVKSQDEVLSGARDHFQAGLEIRQRLAAADPDNTAWQHDEARIAAELRDLDAEDD